MIELKEFAKSIGNKPVLVFGLGRTGVSLLKALTKAGIKVVIGDDKPESIAALEGPGIDVLKDYDGDFSKYALLLLSPGVPLTHPEPHRVVQRAKEAGVEVIGDVEFFFRYAPACRTIGVTGTNGKSTTVSLLEHILKTCKKSVELAGNIGRPVFDIKKPKPETVIVLELSSFQIDLCPTFRPDVSVVLNVTPDHLDRHGTIEDYAAVKERLLQPPSSGHPGGAIIAIDDHYTKEMRARAAALASRKIIDVSTLAEPAAGSVYVKDGILFDHTGDILMEVGNLNDILTLMGAHNHQNAATAYAAARSCGLAMEEIFAAMRSFPGLQHRQYLIRTINGVSYVNDSKATNAAAAAMALACRSHIYWIVGGRKKKNGLEGLEEFFPRIKHAFLIGEATEDFAHWFDKYGMEYTKAYTLEHAVDRAHQMAQDNRGQPGGAGLVLLSPACASFDQFKSFEDRGERFLSLVNDLNEDL
jgi:UDP-N-acetylmuramoylalanine--D-glutamate ligase